LNSFTTKQNFKPIAWIAA